MLRSFSHAFLKSFQVWALTFWVNLGFPDSSVGKESTCNSGDLGSIPGLGRSRGEGKGYPLQYSGLENSTDCIVHEVAKSWAQLRDFHFPCGEREGHVWIFCTRVSSCPSAIQDTVFSSGRAMAPVLESNDLESKGLFPHSTMIKKSTLTSATQCLDYCSLVCKIWCSKFPMHILKNVQLKKVGKKQKGTQSRKKEWLTEKNVAPSLARMTKKAGDTSGILGRAIEK